MKIKISDQALGLFVVLILVLGGWFLFLGPSAGPSVDENAVNFIDPSKNRDSSGEEGQEEPGNEEIPETQAVLFSVPFTPQAPLGNWDDPRQQDGCEEASALMAVRWATDRGLTLAEAEKEIIAISDWEQENYGQFHDSSAKDTAERIIKEYLKYPNVRVEYFITAEDIKRELYKGNLVIVPTDGRKLNNPYFSGDGPERHMFPVIGYDPAAKEFIVNDNGTRRGEKYRYSENILENAIVDYPTGYHAPIENYRTAMIVVSK
ncbi:MAG: C39 family peptidase [Candidatus Spechtbacterales bacterium]